MTATLEENVFLCIDIVCFIITEMQLRDDDLNDLNREDINAEFCNFSFGERKKLWLFFLRQISLLRTSKQRPHEVSLEKSEYELEGDNLIQATYLKQELRY